MGRSIEEEDMRREERLEKLREGFLQTLGRYTCRFTETLLTEILTASQNWAEAMDDAMQFEERAIFARGRAAKVFVKTTEYLDENAVLCALEVEQ